MNIFGRIKEYFSDNIDHNNVLIYPLLILLIQVIIIFIFTLLGFIYEINEAFVEHPVANILPITLVIVIL